MKRFKNVLVATDTSLDEHPIVDHAAEIAQESNAALKLMDVIPAFSWFARRSTAELEKMSELYCREKKEKLEALAAPIRNRGIDVETKVVSGKTSVEIIREVMRSDHDLVMAVSKGRTSTRKGFFGQTAVGLLRQCPCAVWLVTSGAASKVEHVLGCVDVSSDQPMDAELNDKIYELTASIGQDHGARFSIVHAWVMVDEALLSRRLDSEYVAGFEREDRDYRKKLFDKFLAQHNSSSEAENVHLIKGFAPDVISSFVKKNGVDLVVMGTVARSGLLGFLMGNTAEKILDRLECSVLALKPYSFKSQIRPA